MKFWAIGASAMLALAPMEAQARDFVGEIVMSSFGVCPPGTAEANGALVPIQGSAPTSGEDYRDLYLLYGTAYGGDGKLTFGLPDLRAQVLAINSFGKAAPKVAGKDAAPAMQAALPLIYCVVLHSDKPGK